MNVLGLVFVGTRTPAPADTQDQERTVGSQEYVHVRGPDGRLYELVPSAPQV